MNGQDKVVATKKKHDRAIYMILYNIAIASLLFFFFLICFVAVTFF